MALLTIFINIIIPIFVIVGIGATMHRTFQLDLRTLAKINIYYLVPGLIFIRLYETEFSWSVFTSILIFFVLFSVFLYIVSEIISRVFHFNKSLRIAFSNSALFYNSGNYGVPVNDLVFRQDPFAMSIQVFILTFQNLLVYSYGIFTLQAATSGYLKAFIEYLKMPVTYAMILGISLNIFNIPLPTFLYTPGSYIADALIGIALLTLGAQVVQLKLSKNLFTVYMSVFVRLILGPVLAYLVILLINADGITAQAMFISSAMPSSVNSAIIAQEYKNEPEFAAQTVLASTVFSMITVTVVIYLAKILF